MTNLHTAAASGSPEAVREALAGNPDVNITGGPSDFTALLFAVAGTDSEGRQKIVEMLHAAGADLEKKDTEKGLTPLHYAALRNKPLIMQALLRCGANVNATECNGATALHGAAFHGNLEVCRILMQAGADPMMKDKHGYTPLFLAERAGNKQVLDVLKSTASGSAAGSEKKPDDEYLRAVEARNQKCQPLKERRFMPNARYEARATWNENSPAVRLVGLSPLVRMEFSISFRTDGNGMPHDVHDASSRAPLDPEDVIISSFSNVS